MSQQEVGVRTAIGTEQGCSSGNDVLNRMLTISEEAMQWVDCDEADELLLDSFLPEDRDEKVEAARQRMIDVFNLDQIISTCDVCQGNPANANLAPGQKCPVERLAVLKLTFPGVAGVEDQYKWQIKKLT